MERFVGVLGVAVLLGLAWLMSSDRRRVPWRVIVGGIGLQVVLAFLLLRFEPVVRIVEWCSTGVVSVIRLGDEGVAFVFGRALLDQDGPWGFVFAIKVLPVIIFFASLTAVLYHLGIMQRLIICLAWLLRRTMGVTGTEALAVAANVFVGQTEAPLCVKPYIERMTRSQIMTLMTGGFATIAGSVLAAFVTFLSPDAGATASDAAIAAVEADRAMWVKHLLTASVMSAPAAFVIAKIIIPEEDEPIDEGLSLVKGERTSVNVLDAAAAGASDGLRLALNVAAMLIAFVALLALVNWPLQAFGELPAVDRWLDERGIETLNLQTILGVLLMPLAWTMGVPWEDCRFFGGLMAEKLIATELYAYLTLASGINAEEPALGARSAQMAAYALCGFANFASIGIQIGGLTAIAPGQRRAYVQLALRAMLGGAMASWTTATIAGIFIATGAS